MPDNERLQMPDRPFVLAIETSSRIGSVALGTEHKLISEKTFSAPLRHSTELFPAVQDLLHQVHAEPDDIDQVYVSIGPGSFTGLRVGVVCAKMLAWANGADLVLVDTLLAISAESPAEVCRVEIVSDAQRDDLFLGVYEVTKADADSDQVWLRSGSIEIVNAEAWAHGLASRSGDGFAIAGPGVEKAADFLPEGIRQLDRASAEPSASTIARLGEQLAMQGQLADPMTVEPFYLRKSAAEEKRDAAQNGS